jgi:long-chain acyl-CoA synthetase
MEITEKRRKAIEWADGVMQKVKDDPRPYVKVRDGWPVTDLKDLLIKANEYYGDNIAYLQKWDPEGEYEPTTYREVFHDVNGLGTSMMKLGLKDKRVAVIGQNCYQWCSVYLAVTGGIGCIVPLDKELNGEELKNQIIRSEATAVAADSKFINIFEDIKASGDTKLESIISFDLDEEKDGILSWRQMKEEGKKLVEEGEREYLDAEVDNEIMSVLIFTSGTTGVPKGVMINQKNLCSELMMGPTIFELVEDDRFFSFLPLHHTYECTCTFLIGFYKGCSVGFCQGLKYITKNLKEIQPTLLLGVPALYEKLYNTIWKNVRKQGKEKILRRVLKVNRVTKKVGLDLGDIFLKEIRDIFGGRMKTMICGGAKIGPNILEGIKDFGINALQGYGLTEAAPMGALNPQGAPNSAAIGVPLPGQEIKIINKNEEGIGEICLRGENIMMGYLDDPEGTAKVLDEEGWFHTGDLGYTDKDGYTYLTGRAKNVIITKNGKNVYPEELEHQLGLIPFVQESFVFEDENVFGSDTLIVASIKVDEEEIEDILGAEYTDDDIKQLIWQEVDKINDTAPAYRMIKKVILRKSDFVHNTSSKLIRFSEENRNEE